MKKLSYFLLEEMEGRVAVINVIAAPDMSLSSLQNSFIKKVKGRNNYNGIYKHSGEEI